MKLSLTVSLLNLEIKLQHFDCLKEWNLSCLSGPAWRLDILTFPKIHKFTIQLRDSLIKNKSHTIYTHTHTHRPHPCSHPCLIVNATKDVNHLNKKIPLRKAICSGDFKQQFTQWYLCLSTLTPESVFLHGGLCPLFLKDCFVCCGPFSHGSLSPMRASYCSVINSAFYPLLYGSHLIYRQEIMRTEKLREGRSKVPLTLLGSSGWWVTVEQGNLCCGSWVLYDDILSFQDGESQQSVKLICFKGNTSQKTRNVISDTEAADSYEISFHRLQMTMPSHYYSTQKKKCPLRKLVSQDSRAHLGQTISGCKQALSPKWLQFPCSQAPQPTQSPSRLFPLADPSISHRREAPCWCMWL